MGHLFCYALCIRSTETAFTAAVNRLICGCGIEMEEESMKGFTTSAGYMGWVEDRYILFASEYDYREYMEE